MHTNHVAQGYSFQSTAARHLGSSEKMTWCRVSIVHNQKLLHGAVLQFEAL